ncbi:MAG TPA: carbohydrate binding family 9 domain-containing protein, partial [Blastocatellia bacterium]|nr:carbohydrate binding family 9 domain-containing protein [Blastocatellia bacterium]
MKRLVAISILLCLHSITSQARPQQSVNTSSPSSGDVVKPASNSRIALPPEKLNPVRIPRVEKPPVIDGRLDEQIWTSAAVLKDFYQTQPGYNIAPSFKTETLLAYDSRTLYIAFRAHDEPGKVRATVAKRDAVFEADTVQVILDTFNDKRRAYILAFNPLGIQADGILTEGRGEDYSVDIVMESKGVVTEEGYTVEIAIPFKSLRYEAGKGKLWGFHALRRVKRLENEQNSWMPISRETSGILNQGGHITGFEEIATERSLEIIPTVTISEEGRRVATLPSSA